MSSRSEVFSALSAYLDAFMAGDDDALRDCLMWPCTVLSDCGSIQVDTFPYNPATLRAQKGWAFSKGLEIDVVAVSDNKAHVLLRHCQRLRLDGSLIEDISAFYAFTKTVEGWKIFAISGLILPS